MKSNIHLGKQWQIYSFLVCGDVQFGGEQGEVPQSPIGLIMVESNLPCQFVSEYGTDSPPKQLFV